jgi:pimeloyl-ACP methyl ester carboxylesterase
MIAELSGVQLGFDDVGSGTPVVFIHGFPHDRSLWSGQVSALSTYARCIVPDLRGFGESSTEGPFSVDQYADDIAQLLTYLDIERAVVCGLSMGGYVAMAMWRRHADRVTALALCDTKAAADTEEGRRKRDELIAVAEREGSLAIAELQLPGMVGKSTRAKRPEVMAHMRQMMERAQVAGIVGALTAMRDRPDAKPTLAAVTVPVLVIVGDEDVLTPVSEATAMLAALGTNVAKTMEVVEGAGHVTCVERPAAVTHVLADFLATLPVHS